MPDSMHFSLEALAGGVYAAIHRMGGAAYSNCGIIDLGTHTLVVDAFNSLAAGRDLRITAETLFARPVQTIVLTHPHSDHWIGASVFDPSTTILTSRKIRQVCLEWGAEMMQEFQDSAGWEAWLKQQEQQLQEEQDGQRRAALKQSIVQIRFTIAEMTEYQPRYADMTVEGSVTFHGSSREAELRSMGRGHSEEDLVLLLPQDGIAFIGDVGFFACQPFLGYCDIDLYRQQLQFFLDSDYQVLVPGHGPLGNKGDVALQLKYFDVLEELVGGAIQRGDSFDEVRRLALPEPFDGWQVAGRQRFEANVRYLFERYGGEVPEEL